MSERQTKRVNGWFLQQPEAGDVVVNANRHTDRIPRYRVTKVNRNSVRLVGLDTNLDFIVSLTSKAKRAQFTKEQV
jgi:hypothetical protein